MDAKKLGMGLGLVVLVLVGLGMVRQKQMRDDFDRRHPPTVPTGLMMVHYGASW